MKKVIVTVITHLTENQAAQISSDILKAKTRYSRQGSATVAVTSEEKLGHIIDSTAKVKPGRIGRK